MIGTDLHVIESNSNEVSHSTENQNESLQQILKKQVAASADDQNYDKHDDMLEQLNLKNDHALLHIKHEKDKLMRLVHDLEADQMQEPHLKKPRQDAHHIKYISQPPNQYETYQPSIHEQQPPLPKKIAKLKKQINKVACFSTDFKIEDGELFSQEFQLMKSLENATIISGEVNQKKINSGYNNRAP